MHGHVEDVRQLTPHMVRISLGGQGLADFEPRPYTDSYLNIALPPVDAPYTMPCDLTEARSLPAAHQPARRRYTVRKWDPKTRRLSIDFVVHGDSGVAGPWAAAATSGDVLQFEGPSGGYSPDPDADWHLLVGDEAALPAIAASLERLSPGAVAHVLLETDGPDEDLPLDSPADIALRWIHRSADDGGLAAAVRDLQFPSGQPHAFVHGEAAMVRTLRYHLLAEREIPRARLSASPYWRSEMNDEAWRAVKKQWTAEMEQDV